MWPCFLGSFSYICLFSVALAQFIGQRCIFWDDMLWYLSEPSTPVSPSRHCLLIVSCQIIHVQQADKSKTSVIIHFTA